MTAVDDLELDILIELLKTAAVLSVLLVVLLVVCLIFARDWLGRLEKAIAADGRSWKSTLSALLASSTEERVTLALLTFAGLAIRCTGLRQPLGTDEAESFFYYGSRPLVVGLAVYGTPNNHLLHTMAMHAAYRAFGDGEWALRLPALIAGALMIPLTWVAARALRSHSALLAAALVAGWPLLVDFSANGRGYTMLASFILIAAVAMPAIIDDENRVAAFAFAVSCALGFFTIPLMIYPFCGLIAWGILESHNLSSRKLVAISGVSALALTGFFYLPVLIVSGVGAITANKWVVPLPFRAFLQVLPHFGAALVLDAFSGLPPVVGAILGLMFIAGFIQNRRLRRYWLCSAGAMLLVLSLQHTVPYPRTCLLFLPFAFITMVAGIEIRHRGVVRLVTLVLFALPAFYSLRGDRLPETGRLRDVIPVAAWLGAHMSPSDVVIATPPSDVPLALYLRKDGVDPSFVGRLLEPGGRAWVIVNREYGPGMEEMLTHSRVDLRSARITAVRSSPWSEIILLEPNRRVSAPTAAHPSP